MALSYEDLIEPAIVKQVSKTVAYCRCTRTKTPPFCDGSHAAFPAFPRGAERGFQHLANEPEGLIETVGIEAPAGVDVADLHSPARMSPLAIVRFPPEAKDEYLVGRCRRTFHHHLPRRPDIGPGLYRGGCRAVTAPARQRHGRITDVFQTSVGHQKNTATRGPDMYNWRLNTRCRGTTVE